DDRVEAALLVMALDLQQREELVHARRHRQLLGGDLVDAVFREQLAEPLLNRLPMALHLLLRLNLLTPEAIAASSRLAAELGFERIGEAVRRIGRQDDRVQPARGAAPGGRGGDA